MAKNRKTPDMNQPVWFDGQNINEALFCEEFLHERRIIFANGAYDALVYCEQTFQRNIKNLLEWVSSIKGILPL